MTHYTRLLWSVFHEKIRVTDLDLKFNRFIRKPVIRSMMCAESRVKDCEDQELGFSRVNNLGNQRYID